MACIDATHQGACRSVLWKAGASMLLRRAHERRKDGTRVRGVAVAGPTQDHQLLRQRLGFAGGDLVPEITTLAPCHLA